MFSDIIFTLFHDFLLSVTEKRASLCSLGGGGVIFLKNHPPQNPLFFFFGGFLGKITPPESLGCISVDTRG